jgi:hypothetical protein
MILIKYALHLNLKPKKRKGNVYVDLERNPPQKPKYKIWTRLCESSFCPKKKKLQSQKNKISVRKALFCNFIVILFLFLIGVSLKISANHSVDFEFGKIYAPLTTKVQILHSFSSTEAQFQPSTIDPFFFLLHGIVSVTVPISTTSTSFVFFTLNRSFWVRKRWEIKELKIGSKIN